MVGGGISHPLKQMILDERNRIEFHVACGLKIPRIAELLGRNPTSIREEILKHRLDSNKHYGCSNRLCARFDECTRTIFNGFKDRVRKNTPKCFESCPDFREASCPRLSRSPFVCNGCEQERECPMKNLFNGHAKSTVYGWIANGLFSAKTHDLPFAGTRRKPHIERFHNELRRILQKGTSFDPLTQEQIALTLSHLNSYPRESLGGRTPYDVFVNLSKIRLLRKSSFSAATVTDADSDRYESMPCVRLLLDGAA